MMSTRRLGPPALLLGVLAAMNSRLVIGATRLLLALAVPALLSAQGPAAWRLVEVWRKGGEPDGPYAFESVRDVKALPGGRLIILDRRSAQLHVYDSSGTVIRSIGRVGGGPGEFRFPFGVAVAPDGRFAVNDPQQSRISLFAADGSYERGVTLRRQPHIYFNVLWDATFDRTGRLVASVGLPPKAPNPRVPGSMSPFADSVLVTERWTSDFTRADTLQLCASPQPVHTSPTHYALVSQGGAGRPPGGWVGWNEIPFTAQRPYFARDLDGHEWGPREYGSGELVRRESGRCASILARIALHGGRAPIPSSMRDSALRNVRDEHRSRVPREYAWYRSLRVDDQNNLWVERDVDGGRRFDVFAPDGRALAEVTVPPTLDTDLRYQTPHVVVAHGRVYGFVKDADDVPYLVAWRIVRQR